MDLRDPSSKGREGKDRGGEGREGNGERGKEGKGEGCVMAFGGWTLLNTAYLIEGLIAKKEAYE